MQWPDVRNHLRVVGSAVRKRKKRAPAAYKGSSKPRGIIFSISQPPSKNLTAIHHIIAHFTDILTPQFTRSPKHYTLDQCTSHIESKADSRGKKPALTYIRCIFPRLPHLPLLPLSRSYLDLQSSKPAKTAQLAKPRVALHSRATSRT